MRLSILLVTVGCLWSTQLIAASPALPSPDAVYLNGAVWTGGDNTDLVEAFAVAGGRITATGSNAAISAIAGKQTIKVDLHHHFVVPGFTDSHTHFLASSLALSAVQLRDAATPEEFTRRIGARAKAFPGEWVLHGTWDHELWNSVLPTRDWIDGVTGTTPVYVERLDGHMGLANSEALKRAGIDEHTPDPSGGTIVRDAKGRPTGVLKDEAAKLIERVIPPPSVVIEDDAMRHGMAEAASHGVTQINDMSDGNWRTLEAFRRAEASGKLSLRAYTFVPIADWKTLSDFIGTNGRGDDWVRWGGVKIFTDGSLGSTTAWFYKPYTDAPDTSGLIKDDPAHMIDLIRSADRAGLQVAAHAIGDQANDWLLNTFERVGRENGARDRRFRVEHAQHLTQAAIPRFAKQGVIASMQPYHAIDDGRWAEKRIGAERLKGTYAFRSLLDAHAHLAFGSDWSVAPIDPIAGIDAAVTRRTIDGRNPDGWQPQERITVLDALRSYTSEAAYAGFREGVIGQIKPGYYADFVELSDNLFTIDPSKIVSVKVLRTVVGGKESYAAKDTPSSQ